jgi:hypothetical protein
MASMGLSRTEKIPHTNNTADNNSTRYLFLNDQDINECTINNSVNCERIMLSLKLNTSRNQLKWKRVSAEESDKKGAVQNI